MTDKGSQLYAMIEDYRLALDAELKQQLDVKAAAEKRIEEIRGEQATLPVRPPKQPKGKKNGRKAKRAKSAREVAEEIDANASLRAESTE